MGMLFSLLESPDRVLLSSLPSTLHLDQPLSDTPGLMHLMTRPGPQAVLLPALKALHW